MHDLSSFLKSIDLSPITILDKQISFEKFIPLDLSETNPALLTFNSNSSSEWEQFITNYLIKNNGQVAFGGYLEKRSLYKRSNHFYKNDSYLERNIHLGIDLWTTSGTPIYAPLDGKVHSFANNTNLGDYGPTIIMKHYIKGVQFHTLYGHLSENSITRLKVGEEFKTGKYLGALGKASVNGDYAPHLHFQIIKDIQNYRGDYPGVCSDKDLAFYSNNCPNPNTILKLY